MNAVGHTITTQHALLIAIAAGVLIGGGTMFTLVPDASASGHLTGDTGNSSTTGETAPSTIDQQQQAESVGDTISITAINVSDEPLLGDPDAPVTIVEYGDYQCPYCRQFALQTLPPIRQNYIDSGDVRYVYKDYPIESRHDRAVEMAEAAHCAGDQDRYWAMHDKLFAEQQNISPRSTATFSADRIPQWAADIGLDMDAFNRCMDDDTYRSAIQADRGEGKQIDIPGTPTFVVYTTGSDTGTLMPGIQTFNSFQPVIENRLDAAGDDRDLQSWDTAVDDPRVITVTAEQSRLTPATITAKKGEWIKIEGTTTDRTHGLAIPRYGIGLRLQPNVTVRSPPFRVTHTGTFDITCGRVCDGDERIQGTLKVTEE